MEYHISKGVLHVEQFSITKESTKLRALHIHIGSTIFWNTQRENIQVASTAEKSLNRWEPVLIGGQQREVAILPKT
jgi:hypothetical protein